MKNGITLLKLSLYAVVRKRTTFFSNSQIGKENFLFNLRKKRKHFFSNLGDRKEKFLLLSKNQDDGSYNIFTWGRVEKMSESDLKKYLKTAQISDN